MGNMADTTKHSDGSKPKATKSLTLDWCWSLPGRHCVSCQVDNDCVELHGNSYIDVCCDHQVNDMPSNNFKPTESELEAQP